MDTATSALCITCGRENKDKWKLECDIASDMRDFAKVSTFTELKNFKITLSVFMVVDSQI